jgi:hypothetical protein
LFGCERTEVGVGVTIGFLKTKAAAARLEPGKDNRLLPIWGKFGIELTLSSINSLFIGSSLKVKS